MDDKNLMKWVDSIGLSADQIQTDIKEMKKALQEKELKNHYITFGSDGNMPLQGGWVIVRAVSLREAQDKFIKRFGDSAMSVNGFINYCSDYSQEYYDKSVAEGRMFATGNMGKFLHEIIE